jgi:hypothetical protein
MQWKTPVLVAAAFVAGSFVTWKFTEVRTAAAAAKPVYELRTYTTLPGRLPNLEKRFRDHTTKLFAKHGMKNVGYWVPQDAPAKDNTLIYILAHESREKADASWKAFAADPDWKTVREASEADGKIVQKVDRVYMNSTDYSPIQ